jgi:two-component system cell cycle response regulator
MTKVIIVEDDAMISEIYQKKFSDSGFEVFMADSGEKALELAKKENPDMMLLDLIMPKMDGFEVIENMRKSEFGNETKIFVLSNLSQKEDRDRAMGLGANGFIVKSDYSPSDLVKEVSRLFNQIQEVKKNGILKEKIKNGIIEDTNKKRILLIEDEKIFLEMFGDKLRQDGFEVETTNNGGWGMKEALEKDFDIFIIDMMMPVMTGDEIVAKLKTEEKTKNIPIIVLSASVENQVEKKVRKMGVDEFFVKTQIVPSMLSKRVSELLKNK